MESRDISMLQPQLALDEAFYKTVREAASVAKRKVSEIVQPFSGKGFAVPAGHTFRVMLEEGPQVADIGLWNLHDAKETLNAPRTWLLEAWFIKVGTRLWSDIPHLRPLATCVTDTVPSPPNSAYHHHATGTHCATEWIELRSGVSGLNSCRLNLLEAIEPFGLSEEHIRDNVNVHQKIRIDPVDGKTYAARSDGSKGDYVEFYSEIDLLVAVSVCPNADNSRYWSRPEDNAVKPVRFEVFDTGIIPKPSPVWTDWRDSWQGAWLTGNGTARSESA